MTTPKSRWLGRLLVAGICGLMAGGCYFTTQRRSSSVVDYLYPETNGHAEVAGIPRLELPLRVGVAFVPESTETTETLTERDKMELMHEVSGRFKKQQFVDSIELIPSAYLRRHGSFANLDQLRTMYGIDVVALLSYDQTQFVDDSLASITYWTLIGAYVVPGEKNDTHTMVDAAVYHIQSRRMLFRAPGTSHVKSKATPVNVPKQLREDSLASFKLASDQLVENLQVQLAQFEEKVKQTPDDYQVVHRPGYTGSGGIDGAFATILGLMGGVRICASWRRKARIREVRRSRSRFYRKASSSCHPWTGISVSHSSVSRKVISIRREVRNLSTGVPLSRLSPLVPQGHTK